jgi:hypothetical protein
MTGGKLCLRAATTLLDFIESFGEIIDKQFGCRFVELGYRMSVCEEEERIVLAAVGTRRSVAECDFGNGEGFSSVSFSGIVILGMFSSGYKMSGEDS